MKKLLLPIFIFLIASLYAQPFQGVGREARISGDYTLPNLVPPLDYEDDIEFFTHASEYIPVKDESFLEHVRISLSPGEEKDILGMFSANEEKLTVSGYSELLGVPITSVVNRNGEDWIGTTEGLYILHEGSDLPERYNSYGVNGPLATNITGMAIDSKGTLWIGTPIGLSVLKPDGTWHGIRGSQGLPVENITILAITNNNRLWLGTNQGAILYTPYEEGRQWYYRAGKRYLINDHISDIIIADEGMPAYFKTEHGISKLEAVEMTLAKRAEIIETRINKWHRREGLVAGCVFDDAENPTSHVIGDNDNDGLWTSYHVVAMSLAFGATGNEAYLESAKEGMHAMIMLQNASGIPGLVARSVLPMSKRDNKNEQWRNTPDGKMIWKSDTSNDEIDGHFFAFYAYWEHIARFNAAEDALIKKQIRDIMNYIVDNNYQLIDWDGERTKWGFWNPETLNGDPEHYIENGLNAAQILSFLKVSYHITSDKKFKEHYDYLITEHGYLGNILLEKKVFPDANNHSDNQLGFCALYPLLQLEYGDKARNVLQRAVRRHYRTLSRDGSSFFYFAAATIDPDFVDIRGGVIGLRQTPTDRRQWQMINSNRADITWSPYITRFGRQQLLTVLPADERNWGKWNGNPYYPDGGGDGRYEDDGASWLLGYWMGRYHGFISDAE